MRIYTYAVRVQKNVLGGERRACAHRELDSQATTYCLRAGTLMMALLLMKQIRM